MEYLDLAPTIVGQDGDSSIASSEPWMIVEQDHIPEDQQQVTVQEAKSMVSAALSGYSAFRGISSCPVRRTSDGQGNHTATYNATVLIHKSNQIDDYDLAITKDGVPIKYGFPRREYRRKSKAFDINYNQTVQLGYQPHSGFTGSWSVPFGVWDIHSNRIPVLSQPAVDQYDGFLTLKGDLAFGIIDVSCLAVMDIVTVTIEHKLGTQWGSNVRAEVRWPAGADPEFQNTAECEILLPGCAEAAFNDCAVNDDDPLTWNDDDYWYNIFSFGPVGPTKVFWNKCSQKIIEVTNDNRDTL